VRRPFPEVYVFIQSRRIMDWAKRFYGVFPRSVLGPDSERDLFLDRGGKGSEFDSKLSGKKGDQGPSQGLGKSLSVFGGVSDTAVVALDLYTAHRPTVSRSMSGCVVSS